MGCDLVSKCFEEFVVACSDIMMRLCVYGDHGSWLSVLLWLRLAFVVSVSLVLMCSMVLEVMVYVSFSDVFNGLGGVGVSLVQMC